MRRYLTNYDYDNAVRYLNFSQVLYEVMGNIPKYCGVLRTLIECYDRLNRPDKKAPLHDKIVDLENELRKKVTTFATQRLRGLPYCIVYTF